MGKARPWMAALVVALVAACPAAAADAATRGWAEGELIVALPHRTPIDDVLRRLPIEYPKIGFPTIPDVKGPRAGPEELDRLVATCQPYYDVPLPDLYVLRFDTDRQAGAAVHALRADARVAFAQRNYLTRTLSDDPPIPDDERFGEQWNLRNTGQGPRSQLWGDPVPDSDIDAPEAWAMGAEGEGVTVAVLDDGVELDHPDLEHNIWINTGEYGPDGDAAGLRSNGIDDDGNGYVDDWHGWRVVAYPWAPNNDPNGAGHGTHVAGIVAAERNNGIGIAGVAPKAKIMPVVSVNSSIPDTLEALGGFAYAIRNHADVINNSWGFILPAGHGSPIVSLAVDCANRAGIVISWAGGNFFGYPDANPAYNPAVNVLVVGDSDRYDQRDLHSFFLAPLQDVMAPGEDVLSTWWWGSEGRQQAYKTDSGTSMAAPHVAGVAALLLSKHPGLKPYEVKWFIKQGVEFSPTLAPWSSSLGRLNAAGALRKADDPGPIPPLPDP